MPLDPRFSPPSSEVRSFAANPCFRTLVAFESTFPLIVTVLIPIVWKTLKSPRLLFEVSRILSLFPATKP